MTKIFVKSSEYLEDKICGACNVGDLVGDEVVGELVGSDVVGDFVGVEVVGACEGDVVGDFDGFEEVGENEGDIVGAIVGGLTRGDEIMNIGEISNRFRVIEPPKPDRESYNVQGPLLDEE